MMAWSPGDGAPPHPSQGVRRTHGTQRSILAPCTRPAVSWLDLAIRFNSRQGKTMTTKIEGDILTLDEVAVYLKAGKRTIYRLAAAKQIPAFKVGATWRFSRSDIDVWIKQQSKDALDPGRKQPKAMKRK